MGCYGHGRAREWVLGGASRAHDRLDDDPGADESLKRSQGRAAHHGHRQAGVVHQRVRHRAEAVPPRPAVRGDDQRAAFVLGDVRATHAPARRAPPRSRGPPPAWHSATPSANRCSPPASPAMTRWRRRRAQQFVEAVEAGSCTLTSSRLAGADRPPATARGARQPAIGEPSTKRGSSPSVLLQASDPVSPCR